MSWSNFAFDVDVFSANVERLRVFPVVAGVHLLLMLAAGAQVFAQGAAVLSEEQVTQKAKVAWESGAVLTALDLLDQGIHAYPKAVALHKLRGDILATFRGPQEAVRAYDLVLATEPAALDVRWAKWSVLVWWGKAEEAIAELRRIVESDSRNPLAHLKLAQELRKADRLEESLESYRKAVELVPGLLGWRLALARARFDVLDYSGAEADLNYVLERVQPGSPLALQAKNQLAQLHESIDRGRRFTHVLTPGSTASQLKEWAAIRANAWKLFVAGRYQEAEPIYRRMLALNPRDTVATFQLGVTLMQLGRCEEALTVFGSLAQLDPSEEDYADATFRMGQCLVELKRWEDAYVHFQQLYDAAVEFESANKDVALPGGMRVLSKEKIARWLDKVRPHIQEAGSVETGGSGETSIIDEATGQSLEAEPSLAFLERITPQNTLDSRVALMGRDADFSWFRFVIPASKVVRDDFPTGAHDFIPLSPGDTFPPTQQEIYLVFGLVSPSYDAVSLTAQCFVETEEHRGDQLAVAGDRVMTATNDQSGYFMLTPPDTGWKPGLYRCGLFTGDRTNAYTLVDEVRFRIAEPHRRSPAGKPE